MIIDAWAQHPTLRHSQDSIFDSLRRWNREQAPTEQLPVEATIRVMDEAGVAKSLISAWVAPRNVMISNDEVADFVSEFPDRLIGIGSVDISKPMQAVAEIKRCKGTQFHPLVAEEFLELLQSPELDTLRQLDGYFSDISL